MNPPFFQRNELVAWILSALSLLLILYLNLLPALIAGLMVYALVNVLTPLLRTRLLWGEGPRLLAVSLIAGAIIGLFVLIAVFTSSLLRDSNESVPALINRMAEIIEHSRNQMPPWISDNLPENAEQLRLTLVTWLRANADIFQMAGTGLGRVLAHIVIGVVIGFLLSLESIAPGTKPGLLTAEFANRAQRLGLAFRRVVFAQVWISAINTTLTAIYLAFVLPMFDIHLPFTKTLIVATFLLGLLPILGNLISNTVIFVVSLSHSLLVAIAALSYLIVIHKLEYFLNARIIGGQIRARAWEMLLSMLVMEAAFGIAGLIAAPIYYAYLKDELREKGLV